MRALRYLPDADAAQVPNVVVDGSSNASTVLTLSHWPGTIAPEATWADTSTEMVLRYVESGGGFHHTANVATNNHFDQDGLAGLFLLIDPEAALARRHLLVDLARAGDFATYRSRDAARASMALAAMAVAAPDGPYPAQCAALYVEALDLLPELLDAPGRFRALWADEDASLAASETAVAAGRVNVRELPDLDLAVVAIDPTLRLDGGTRFGGRQVDGLHPMALHATTSSSRVLVAHGDRYRFTFRYESWVQYRSRAVPLRVDLAPLAEELTSLERDGARWSASPVRDLTPELATVEEGPSSLPSADVEAALVRHLARGTVAWDPFVGHAGES